MLGPGDTVPDARVWLAPHEIVLMQEVVEDRAALLLFYLFDWSRT